MFLNSDLRVKVDNEYKILWIGIDLKGKLCYSLNFLDNFINIQELVKYICKKENIKYVVSYSFNKGVLNLGGDLEFFVSSIRNKKRNDLKDYAYRCIEYVHNINNNYDLDIITTSVIHGNDFGASFEAILSRNFIVAEESAKFSFPEVTFGTLPGIGSYNLIASKIGVDKALEIINSNKTFSAQEILDLGIINKISPNGNGISTISKMIISGEIDKHVSNPNNNLLYKVSIQELLEITNDWLERCFNLNESTLEKMNKLANFQKKKFDKTVSLISKIEEDYNITEEYTISELNELSSIHIIGFETSNSKKKSKDKGTDHTGPRRKK